MIALSATDKEIDRATWRRYLYRVRTFRNTQQPPYFGVTCRHDAAIADGLVCDSCGEAARDWLVRNHHRVAEGGPAPASNMAAFA